MMAQKTKEKHSVDTPYDTKRMFEHGCAFIDCARNCEIEPNNIEYRMHSHTVSGIVNSAFSCEIFLKTLLVFNSKKPYGHELKVLWNDFKKSDRETALLIEKGLQNWFNSKNDNLFNELLNESSDAFEYWRYIYEKQNAKININFLIGLRTVLREICCNKLFQMTWEEYKNRRN